MTTDNLWDNLDSHEKNNEKNNSQWWENTYKDHVNDNFHNDKKECDECKINTEHGIKQITKERTNELRQ